MRRLASGPIGGLAVEQSALAFDTPGVSRERTVLADHTVTGDRDGEIVRGARSGYRPYRFRGSDAPSDLRIGHLLADRNGLERLPYASLEGRAANVQGKMHADAGCLDETDDPRDQGLVVAIGTDQMRLLKAVLEVADELVRIVSEQDRSDAVLTGGHEDGAKRCLSEGK